MEICKGELEIRRSVGDVLKFALPPMVIRNDTILTKTCYFQVTNAAYRKPMQMLGAVSSRRQWNFC